jgi:hypothetical protein
MNLIKGFLPTFQRLTIFLAAVVTGFVVAAPPTHARDLTGRLGIGYADQFADYSPFFDMPSLSAKYTITKDLAIQGIVGFNTREPSGYTVAAKIIKNIFFENHLNFYGAAVVGLLKRSETGFGLQGLFGMEAFIPGIESLGLSFEAGVAASNVTGDFEIRTVGMSFLHAGVHFYF